jgi:hypothetical protein
MAVIGRLVVPVAAALALASAIAAASFAVVRTLPQPTHGDRTGVRLLDVLENSRGVGSRIAIGGRSLVARCTPLTGRQNLISVSNGSSLVLAGSHIRASKPPEKGATSELASTPEQSPLLRAAIADLSGSYALYATELAIQLARGSRVIRKEIVHNGRPAYEIELGDELPRAALIVDRRTLRPLAALFESARLHGKALLEPPVGALSEAAC